MPLWNIYHPVAAFDVGERTRMAEAITACYPVLPRFYVGIVFQEIAADQFFVGGDLAKNFVRISIDHIARQFPNDDVRQRWLAMVNGALEPFIAARGFDWELHVDETPPEIWLIQGMRPPPPDSEQEKLWIRENRPVPVPPK